MARQDGEDLSSLAAELLIKSFIDKRRRWLEMGAKLRNNWSPEQIKAIEDSHQDPYLDDINMAFAISKMSASTLDEWEAHLNAIEAIIDNDLTSVLGLTDVKILNLFIMLLAEFKPRSKTHLLHFLEIATEGNWVDGFIQAKGTDSEFRYVDHATDETRSEFGLRSGPKNKN